MFWSSIKTYAKNKPQAWKPEPLGGSSPKLNPSIRSIFYRYHMQCCMNAQQEERVFFLMLCNMLFRVIFLSFDLLEIFGAVDDIILLPIYSDLLYNVNPINIPNLHANI